MKAMRKHGLSTQIMIGVALTLVVFSAASFGVLYRAQSELAVREMESLLHTEALTISSLVTLKSNNTYDFEFSSSFLARYTTANDAGFFRIFSRSSGVLLRESAHAPDIGCKAQEMESYAVEKVRGTEFHTVHFLFQPEMDEDSVRRDVAPTSELCLVIGIGEAPFHQMVTQTIFSAGPFLLGLVIFALLVVFLLIKKFTSDLTALKGAIQNTDFGATHAFPELPEAKTSEVSAIIEKLAVLHGQAAHVYQEMWLFLGRAAHQLKTPVTALQATLDVLVRKDRTKEELMTGLIDVQTAVAQMVKLTQRLLASSRVQFETPSDSIDVTRFFNELVRLFVPQAQARGVSIKVMPSPEVHITASSTSLSELFSNLLDNAIRYTKPNSEVKLQWQVGDGKIEITVCDEGPGFPERVQQNLFVPFVRGDERNDLGCGLGLSIAKRIARQAGGDLVLARSGPDGSVMRVTLPVAIS